MKLAELLSAVPQKHRAIVATRLGLPARGNAQEIADALHSKDRLEQIIAGCSDDARRFLARQAIDPGQGTDGTYWMTGGVAGGAELERYGLAFAVRTDWRTAYVVPDDLLAPVAAALTQPLIRAMQDTGAERWLDGGHQLTHDAVTIWAALHREPVRVKNDGVIYQRATPKLVAALAPTDLDDAGGPDLKAFQLGERIDTALRFLRDESCLRLRTEGAGRVLAAGGDLTAALSGAPSALRDRMLESVRVDVFDLAARALIPGVPADRAVTLRSFGAAVMVLAGVLTPVRDDLDIDVVGLQASWIPWLIGQLEIGLDASGRPAALRLAPIAGDQTADGGRPLGVCQGNFEVVLLRRPVATERLTLEVACEPVAGQAHVYVITRASAMRGERLGIHPGGVVGALTEIVGELPQNVERTVAGWAAGVRRPLRIRTAMMLDAGDRETAERLAGGPLRRLVVERIGDSLLAFAASSRSDLTKALAAEGVELEPELDEVSGTWSNDRGTPVDAERVWQPQRRSRRPISHTGGKVISTVRDQPPPRRGTGNGNGAGNGPAPHPPHHQVALELDRSELPPIDLILEAMEDGVDVHITYAGARGLAEHTVTPLEVEGAQLLTWSDDLDEEVRFWIPGIRSAQVAEP